MTDAPEVKVSDPNGFTVKELLLRLDAKLDAYISAHEHRHSNEANADILARSDPIHSPAGKMLLAQVHDTREDVAGLGRRVNDQERAIERFKGALAFVSLFGLSTLLVIALRIIGMP